MNASVGGLLAERWIAARTIRDGGIVAATIALVVLVPPLVYGYFVRRQFGFLDLSGYMPYEEARQALAGGDLLGFLATPLLAMNMTSGALLSNMYSLTFGQSILTVCLGTAIALNLIAHLDLRRVCRVTGFHGTTAAAGSGLCATVAASSTSIMGCCGSGIAGGVLTLAGVGAGTAADIAGWSTPVQALFIIGIVLNWLRLRGRLTAAGTGQGVPRTTQVH